MRDARAVGRSCLPRGGIGVASLRLCRILLTAFVTKTLSNFGVQKLDCYDRESIPLSDDLLCDVLRNVSLDISTKLGFFKWCSSRGDYNPSSASYSFIFNSICRAGCLEEIPELLGQMNRDGLSPDSRTLKLLFDSFIRTGRFDSALEILALVDDDSGRALGIYDSAIRALIEKNQLGSAMNILFKLLEVSRTEHFPCSNACCSRLLMALRKAGMRAEFKQVFECLRAHPRRFTMDPWSYNICIHAFGCWGDLATSLKLFDEMKTKCCSSWGPDTRTYNCLMHALCVSGKVRDALRAWEELKETRSHRPDRSSFRILIWGCSKSHLVDTAALIFKEMEHEGLLPDVSVYNSLIHGLFRSRRVREACQLFEKMVGDDGVRPSSWTYNILIHGLFRTGTPEAGHALFQSLKNKGRYRSYIDGITYSIVVLRLCKEKKLEEALKLVEEMEARGFPVDLVTLSSLVVSLQGQGKGADALTKKTASLTLIVDALKWRTDLVASLKSLPNRREDGTPLFHSNDFSGFLGPKARFSLRHGRRVGSKDSFDASMVNTYLCVFLAKGDLSLACKLLEMFADLGIDFSTYVFNSLLTSFVKKGYFEEAWGVLNEMGETACPMDVATYNLVIQNLRGEGRADLARGMLDSLMEHPGGYLDPVMYDTLIRTMGNVGRVDEAVQLFEQMRGTGIIPDASTFNSMIEMHTRSGRVKDAYRFLRLMMDVGCSPNRVTDAVLDDLCREIHKRRSRKNDSDIPSHV